MTGKVFEALVREAEDHAAGLEDVIADTGAIEYEGDHVLGWHPTTLDQSDKGYRTAELETLAYRQFVERMGGPSVRWLEDRNKCPDDLETTVLSRLINHQTAHNRDSMMVRLRKRGMGMTARAVLSSDYEPLDNLELLEMVGAVLGAIPESDIVVMRGYVGDWMRAYILDRSRTFNLPEGGDGGGLHPGIYISNNEVGQGSVRITAGVWRDVCSNGVIYGWNADWNTAIRHRWLKAQAFRDVILNNVVGGFKLSAEAADKLTRSAERPLDTSNLESLFSGWATDGITVKSREAWELSTKISARQYGRGKDYTLFDAVQGLTQAAQFTDNPDETEEMERLAGDLLARLVPSETLTEQ